MTHSFPTRRSSDLHDRQGTDSQFTATDEGDQHGLDQAVAQRGEYDAARRDLMTEPVASIVGQREGDRIHICQTCDQRHHRSEEHTSELQSLMRISYAVFCLKKKTPTNNKTK